MGKPRREVDRLHFPTGGRQYRPALEDVIEFLIVAFAVFLLVKLVTPLMPKPAPAAITTKDCPQCATAIPLAAKRCPNCTSQL